MIKVETLLLLWRCMATIHILKCRTINLVFFRTLVRVRGLGLESFRKLLAVLLEPGIQQILHGNGQSINNITTYRPCWGFRFPRHDPTRRAQFSVFCSYICSAPSTYPIPWLVRNTKTINRTLLLWQCILVLIAVVLTYLYKFCLV